MMHAHDQHKGRTRRGGRKYHQRNHFKANLSNECFSFASRPVMERMWACYRIMQRDANLMVRVSYTDRKKARMELEEL